MKKWMWFGVSALILFFDQLTKHWMLDSLIPYEPKALFPLLNFTLAFNTGAAFSFLSNTGGWHRWFFILFSFVISLALIIWLIKLPKKAFLQALGISLILGGALGNLYDRATYGMVIDFIDVYYNNHHWPIFNLADTAICLGAFFIALELLINRSK